MEFERVKCCRNGFLFVYFLWKTSIRMSIVSKINFRNWTFEFEFLNLNSRFSIFEFESSRRSTSIRLTSVPLMPVRLKWMAVSPVSCMQTTIFSEQGKTNSWHSRQLLQFFPSSKFYFPAQKTQWNCQKVETVLHVTNEWKIVKLIKEKKLEFHVNVCKTEKNFKWNEADSAAYLQLVIHFFLCL